MTFWTIIMQQGRKQPVHARASVAMRDSSSRAITSFSSDVRELKSTPLVPSLGVPATGVPSLLLSSSRT